MMYIGKHKHDGFDPDYYGSGLLLERALNKYGEKNFTVEVVKYFDTEEEAYQYEYELIQERDAVNSEMYYNISPGGDGFREGDMATKDTRWMIDGEIQIRVPEDEIIDRLNEGFIFGMLRSNRWGNIKKSLVGDPILENSHHRGRMIYIHKGSSVKCVRRSKAEKLIATGEWEEGKPPTNKGKNWVYREVNGALETKLICPNELEKYESNGWTQGRPVSFNHYIWFHKTDENHKLLQARVDKDQAQDYLNDGWIPGRCSLRWIHRFDDNNELVQKRVTEDEYDSFISSGWNPGRNRIR